ncbi:MAG: bifunctional DNA primase/polymerase [Pirellulales bacterium]
MNDMLGAVLEYRRHGLCPLPAILAEKRPALTGWKQYQRVLPTEQQVRTWFVEPQPVCLLTGEVSGHLEMIDFDQGGELFAPWAELVAGEAPGLLDRLVIERSQSGGRHVVYRSAVPVPGNRKLAQRTYIVPGPEPVELAGKRYVPRQVNSQFEVTVVLIETRGEGGLFLCAPTPRYEIEQGQLANLPILSESDRAVLIEAACALNETVPPATRIPARYQGTGRPGDDYAERGNVREVLERHGWQRARSGENEYWRRPGKEHGRKVRDEADNRTNLYLLALAYSSVGKDWPRKLNTHILHRIGHVRALGEKFASGEGIQDALFVTPAMLFQTDEIDGLLLAINKSRDARYETMMGTLLTMYSAANSIFPMRRKAGKECPGVIDQPCLVLYGTAIPTHYYEALSERMLTNGLFARMLIVESGPRSTGQDPRIIDPPARVMDTAQWWASFNPGTGNLEDWHPRPRTVVADSQAQSILAESRRMCEREYTAAEASGDPVGTTVWGRVPEQVRKLALLYAVSASHEQPRIDADAAQWATQFMLHQTRRMLFMAHGHVAENPFHAECLKLLRKLREAPGQQLPHSMLLKRMKLDAKTFQELVTTLEQQGDLVTVTHSTAGRPHRRYQLTGCDEEQSEVNKSA